MEIHRQIGSQCLNMGINVESEVEHYSVLNRCVILGVWNVGFKPWGPFRVGADRSDVFEFCRVDLVCTHVGVHGVGTCVS